MASVPQHESEGSLEIGHLRNRSLKATLRRNPQQASGLVEMTPEMLAAVCFDEACIAAGLSNKEIAAACGIASDSLVTRWRNHAHRELPTLVQLHKLGPEFMRLWFRGYSRRHGWGQKALLDLAEGLGAVALAMNE